VINVVVGLVFDDDGQVLIQQRTEPPEMAGLWEFPGGGIEPGEAPAESLIREFREETGITVSLSQPFMRVRHPYPAKTVLLEVLEVTQWSGEAYGAEGQNVAWVAVGDLDDYDMLPANEVMVAALKRSRLKQKS